MADAADLVGVLQQRVLRYTNTRCAYVLSIASRERVWSCTAMHPCPIPHSTKAEYEWATGARANVNWSCPEQHIARWSSGVRLSP